MSDDRYDAVNDGTQFPAITREEAKRAFKALVKAFGKPADAAPRDAPFSEKGWEAPRPLWKTGSPTWWTNGHGYRRVWLCAKPHRGHHKGWGRLIHDVSHMVHRYRNPKAKPHEGDHHRLELEVFNFVREAGWLDRNLMPEPAPKRGSGERREKRHEQLTARLARWESKAKRAENAIRKLKRQLRAIERARNSSANIESEAAAIATTGATQ